MQKNKLILSILSLTCFLSIPTIANAQVDGYLVKNTSTNVVYQYNTKDLLSSLRGNKKLYNKFQNTRKQFGILGYHDDSNKIVSHQDVIKTFLKNKNNFNLNAFIEGENSTCIKLNSVEVVK